MAENPFEIPQQMRDLADQNIKQAHAAYEQLTDFVTKAVGAWMGAIPSPMAAGFKDFQDRAAEIAKKNAESAFALIEKIVKAQTFQEILTLQTQFAQDRMQAFTTQTQQLFGLMGEAFEKSERGAMGAGMSATPSNLLVTAFKDVQDRAVAMAKTNANSAFALIEKIAKAQNIQELLTHQTQFAQEQMQAFATQTQEIQKLIGDALQRSGRG